MLSQLKILDFPTLLPGPFATMVLADLGAEVLRIESPSRVDLNRINPPFVDEKETTSYSHAYLNRNKRSLALDLKNTESIEIIEGLIGTYDIVLEQFRPGVMDRLGLSYAHLSSINPSLIYCSLTGYGQSGPWAERVGHDSSYVPQYRKAGGAVGEDTREILRSFGYDDAAIDALKAKGLFGDVPV